MQCLSCKEPMYGQPKWTAYFSLIFQEVLDKAEGYRQTEAYLKAMRKRSVWVEPPFGEVKEFHRLRRFSPAAFTQSEHRRRDGGSRTKSEKID